MNPLWPTSRSSQTTLTRFTAWGVRVFREGFLEEAESEQGTEVKRSKGTCGCPAWRRWQGLVPKALLAAAATLKMAN